MKNRYSTPLSSQINIVTVVQARTGSSRLPGKILLPLAGKELLVRMIERVNRSAFTGTVVVATTTNPEDDAIEKLCELENFICFRGHETDLLDRHYQAALIYKADAVVKIPSDCPLIDTHVIDRVILYYLDALQRGIPYDYVSNLHPPTYPDGNDVEIMSMDTLKSAWLDANKSFEKEHTTPFIWERPSRFRIGNVKWETGLDYSMSHRFTIDYPEDYRLIKAIYNQLYYVDPFFTLEDIIQFLESEREIYDINKHYLGVNWYRNHLHDLHTVNKTHTRFPSNLKHLWSYQ